MLPSLLLSCEVLAGRKEPVPFPSLEGTPERGPDGPLKWIDLTVLFGREERLSNGQVLRLPSHHLPLLGSHRQLKPNLPSPGHTLPTPDLQHSCLWDWCWLLVIAPAETKDSSVSLISPSPVHYQLLLMLPSRFFSNLYSFFHHIITFLHKPSQPWPAYS